MVMIKFFIVLSFVINPALASDIQNAFSRKDYNGVSEIYKDNPRRSFNAKELVMVSYALRKQGFFRQDIKLNVRLIKLKYLSLHQRLIRDISKGETIDSDDYPEALKVLYWNLMNDYGIIIKGYKNQSQLIKKDHEHYLMFSKMLSELEFREGKVDRFNDKIMAHLTYLKNKVYRFTRSYSAQYVSWQSESTLKGTNSETGLVVTNRGLCVGAEAGWENSFYHFYVDGCFLAGSGGVSSDASSAITYRQSNVPAYGAKFGPGASMIVSTSGSRIGIKVPIIYSVQNLQEPKNNAFRIKENSPLNYIVSLYSRWQFDQWYIQTEFGKYLQQEQTFWGLGIGKNF
jgi:hypothetical protein